MSFAPIPKYKKMSLQMRLVWWIRFKFGWALFKGICLPIVETELPHLNLNEIARSQPIDRNVSGVFTKNVHTQPGK